LRYYDPRVLPELLTVLGRAQQRCLDDGIRVWWWLDRGNMVRRSVSDPAQSGNEPSRPFGTPIVLSDDQVQELLRSSFVDRVLDLAVRTSPDGLRPYDRVDRYFLATRLIEDASRWQLTSEFDCANYIAVALGQGEAFADHPEWADLMIQVRAGSLRFSAAIENWEERHANLG
jgi:hypothetical protein